MVSYSRVLDAWFDALFPPLDLADTLGDVVATAGKRQMRIAETEKYPHVTFFLNGGREEEFTGETRVLIPSPKVKTYDLQPEMSAEMVCDRLVAAIQSGDFDLIICNFANPDMVGYTGVMAAAVRAVETVDHCLGRLKRPLSKPAAGCWSPPTMGISNKCATRRRTGRIPLAYHQSGSGLVDRRPAPGRQLAPRPAGRCRADHSGPYGVISAGGDDRALAVGHRRWRHGGGRGGVAAFF